MIWVWVVLIILAIQALDIWLERRFACTCGRSRPWYFDVRHARSGILVGRALWNTILTVYALITLSWIGGPILAVLAVWTWRAWYFHEKDKLKKKAAKLAGVVGFNDHGKLVIKHAKV